MSRERANMRIVNIVLKGMTQIVLRYQWRGGNISYLASASPCTFINGQSRVVSDSIWYTHNAGQKMVHSQKLSIGVIILRTIIGYSIMIMDKTRDKPIWLSIGAQ